MSSSEQYENSCDNALLPMYHYIAYRPSYAYVPNSLNSVDLSRNLLGIETYCLICYVTSPVDGRHLPLTIHTEVFDEGDWDDDGMYVLNAIGICHDCLIVYHHIDSPTRYLDTIRHSRCFDFTKNLTEWYHKFTYINALKRYTPFDKYTIKFIVDLI